MLIDFNKSFIQFIQFPCIEFGFSDVYIVKSKENRNHPIENKPTEKLNKPDYDCIEKSKIKTDC